MATDTRGRIIVIRSPDAPTEGRWYCADCIKTTAYDYAIDSWGREYECYACHRHYTPAAPTYEVYLSSALSDSPWAGDADSVEAALTAAGSTLSPNARTVARVLHRGTESYWLPIFGDKRSEWAPGKTYVLYAPPTGWQRVSKRRAEQIRQQNSNAVKHGGSW